MKLYDLIKINGDFHIPDCEVLGITDNSNKLKEGYIFVCVKGNSFDGHTFAQKALDIGAVAVVTDHDIGIKNQIIVDDTRKYYGILCAKWFGNPERKVKIIGVTGTNGKTTMTKIIKEILTHCGFRVGLIGTIQNEIGEDIIKTENTTPMTFEFMEILAQMASQKCDYVVMEVSSFGLSQNRIGTVSFDIGVFTNLTQDHLDYHKTMENYYQAKKIMFSICRKAIINTNDSYGKRLYDEIDCEKISYGLSENCDYNAADIKLSSGEISYTIKHNGESKNIGLALTGKFNVFNSIAAIAACLEATSDENKVYSSLSSIHGVKGRCEVIPTGRDFTVICDYAHTPDALENILSSMKEITKGRMICLFGCGGNRDKTKRPLMAKAAAKFSDKLIISSDNPRDEDTMEIIKDIIEGIDNNVLREVIEDREEAIYYAIRTALPGDVIVLAGKGHEDYQVIKNNEHIHFDEREIVEAALKQL